MNKSNTKEISEVFNQANQIETKHTKREWKKKDTKFFKKVLN